MLQLEHLLILIIKYLFLPKNKYFYEKNNYFYEIKNYNFYRFLFLVKFSTHS
jgi:hypothetical protein